MYEPNNPVHPAMNPNLWSEYRSFLSRVKGPKIGVQGLDEPDFVGAIWGVVCSNFHKAFGCVGTIGRRPPIWAELKDC